MLRRKYVLAPFSRGILFYTASTCFRNPYTILSLNVSGIFGTDTTNNLLKENKNKLLRRKHVLVPFSRSI